MTKSKIQNPNYEFYGLMIDTSGEEAWVALVGGREIVSERRWANGPRVGKELLGKIEEMMMEEGVSWDEVKRMGARVVAQRKHSSLRAGITVLNMLGYAKGIELVALREEEQGRIREEFLNDEPREFLRVEYADGS